MFVCVTLPFLSIPSCKKSALTRSLFVVSCCPCNSFDFELTGASGRSLRLECGHTGTACTGVYMVFTGLTRSVSHLSSRLSMLQGRIVPHRPNVWLRGHLHAVLQGEGDGHSAERRGFSGHRPGHRDPVWLGDHVGPQCGIVYGGPAAGPTGWSGFTGGEEKHLHTEYQGIQHVIFTSSLSFRVQAK